MFNLNFNFPGIMLLSNDDYYEKENNVSNKRFFKRCFLLNDVSKCCFWLKVGIFFQIVPELQFLILRRLGSRILILENSFYLNITPCFSFFVQQ